jgi:septal ring factor EnvC (AmiA/AmiB activator)
MNLNIFDLRITTASHLRKLSIDTEAAKRSLNVIESSNAQLRDKVTRLENELLTTTNRLTAAQTREEDLTKRLKEMENRSIDDQNDRLDHNDTLYAVGKYWEQFKKDWKFRQENPRMAPKDRLANNKALNDGITNISATLPKKIVQKTREAEPLGNTELLKKTPKS